MIDLNSIIETLRNAIDLYDDSDDEQKANIATFYNKKDLFDLNLEATILHDAIESV